LFDESGIEIGTGSAFDVKSNTVFFDSHIASYPDVFEANLFLRPQS
jgi:hypothetical protein